MGSDLENIQKKIQAFNGKYYTDLAIRGSLLTLTILFLYFLLVTLLEYAFWLSSVFRFLIVIIFFLIVFYCTYRFLRDPIRFWFARKGMGNEQSARLIGNYFPTVKDRLLNLIQLSGFGKKSALADASVRQRAKDFEPLRFDSVIDFRQNKKYLKYLSFPLLTALALFFINGRIITQSTHRIVHFNEKFSPQAPFQFILQNQSLTGFFNEDFSLNLSLAGEAIPETVYLVTGTQRLKMETLSGGEFRYVFDKLQESKTIQFEAAGFYSPSFEIRIVNRPELTGLNARLEYPRYLQRKTERLVNSGSLEIPEGTTINWEISTASTSEAMMQFSDDQLYPMQLFDNQVFILSKNFKHADQYEIILRNEDSRNKERIAYAIDVIKDQYPQITVNAFRDSILYQRIVLGGIVSDDYGISDLKLHFTVRDGHQKIKFRQSRDVPISTNQIQQSFFHNWHLDSLQLMPGEQLDYYLQAWDNDGVNGRKSTRSATYTFFIPDKDQLATDITKAQSKAQENLEESVDKAKDLRQEIENMNQKMKGKQSLDWQEKKKLEEIVNQKRDLDQFIEELKQQNKLLEQKKDVFTEQDERIREKAEQIQKLMEELLDEETRKLVEELQRLLKENADVNDMQKLLDKLNKNSKNLENELERALELFKQLQYEYKMDQLIEALKQDIIDQELLLDKTDSLEMESERNSRNQKEQQQNEQKTKSEQLSQEQEKLIEDFNKTEEKLEELKKLSEEIGTEKPPGEEEATEVEQSQQESKENLQQNNPSKSKQSQQKAIEKMQDMQKAMESMQNSMMMEMDMQNIDALRQIIHGLIKLSFDQEGLIQEFSELQQSDPRFNGLAQQQLKLKDDAKVLEDSLLALAKRDEMMGSFITREITELNEHLDKAISSNHERKKQQAATEMQLSMTSINNLALMLDSHFDMLMQMMANAKPSMKKSNQRGKQPSMSQMQQQLNEKIQQLKNSGKHGRQLSEELAEMAAEQERIRHALEDMEEKMRQNGKQSPGNEDLTDKMEDTELDLVNKKLTDQLIQRQKEILTRLLETEKSMREQDLDEERKGETAKDYEKEIPKAVEDYLKLKEKEVELLKTVPPKLYPFYRKEVNEYFKRMRETKPQY